MARPSDPNAKSKLLAAAEVEFAQSGLERAKVEDITSRAGLSKGAFYLHFQSKEDAFRQLVEASLLRLAQFVDKRPDELNGAFEGGDVESFLECWARLDSEIFEFVWKNRRVMILMLEGGSSADYRYMVDEFAERSRVTCARHLEEGVRRGFFRDDIDLETASLFISGAYDRFARQLVRSSRKPDIEQTVRTLQLLVLRGVGGRQILAHTDHRHRQAPRVSEVAAVTPNSSRRRAR